MERQNLLVPDQDVLSSRLIPSVVGFQGFGAFCFFWRTNKSIKRLFLPYLILKALISLIHSYEQAH